LIKVDRQLPDTGELRGDVLAMLRSINRDSATPAAAIHRSLIASIAEDPALLAQVREAAAHGGTDGWMTILSRAVARGEARPDALHARIATLAIVLLRNEYITGGITPVPDAVIVEIVDKLYLPLVRRRGTQRADESRPVRVRSGKRRRRR
jgi:hypothetical protein